MAALSRMRLRTDPTSAGEHDRFGSREVHEFANTDAARSAHLRHAKMAECRRSFGETGVGNQSAEAGKTDRVLPNWPVKYEPIAIKGPAEGVQSDATAALDRHYGEDGKPERSQPIGAMLGG